VEDHEALLLRARVAQLEERLREGGRAVSRLEAQVYDLSTKHVHSVARAHLLEGLMELAVSCAPSHMCIV
jgi:hypothetical protein